jgi:hypothetical protein
MYVDKSTLRTKTGKSYTRYLLRESFRENGKVKHRTIANLSHCKMEEIEAIRFALKHKHNLHSLTETGDVEIEQGLSVGAVWTVHQVACELGIARALGNDRQGKLAMWQVIARCLDQGSRLSAVRLAGVHAACDILDIEETFNEDHLYENLDWLCGAQETIEQKLFQKKKKEDGTDNLFLYDVTSSYFEGTQNELAAFGYNRDGKRGKRQIVIGLLCDGRGDPVSIEVFEGNTSDPKTFLPQVRKVAERFGAKDVTFVGDRGMIKGPQIAELAEDVHYITAITKPQIESLLKAGAIQMELFDEVVAEVCLDNGTRYILRRNPVRRDEIAANRRDKLAAARKLIDERNQHLAEHPRAKPAVAQRKVQAKLDRLKISSWVTIHMHDRTLAIQEDAAALAEAAKLDGCYVLKTDLDSGRAPKEVVHDRYKDLAMVEIAFRTCKTVELEARPIHVRLATRTRGHVLVVMLAYLIVAELRRRWRSLDVTVQEGLDQLAQLTAVTVKRSGQARCQQIPTPSYPVRSLLDAAGIHLPDALPSKALRVTTKQKLPARRKSK